jgi:coenzyme F420-reducing hydrogenase delta subunit
MLDWVSSAEAPKYAKLTNEFVAMVRELGPVAEEVGIHHD